MIAMDDEVRFILGRPNFWCGPVARQLVRLGKAEIPRKAEDEQAYVLHWLLGLYEQHGANWRTEADKILTGGLHAA